MWGAYRSPERTFRAPSWNFILLTDGLVTASTLSIPLRHGWLSLWAFGHFLEEHFNTFIDLPSDQMEGTHVERFRDSKARSCDCVGAIAIVNPCSQQGSGVHPETVQG